MSTRRKDKDAAGRAADGDACEELHRPIRSLTWQLFGGFVAVVLTLAMAGAAQLGQKADADQVRQVEAQTREAEQALSEIRAHLAELRTGQEHVRDELRYIRTVLDKERAK